MSAAFPKSADTQSSARMESASGAQTSAGVSAAATTATTSQKDSKDEDKKADPLSAAQRLAESRERLRQYMMQGDGRHEARRRAAAARAEGEQPSAIDRLRAMPVVGVVIDAVSAWWSNHPLHPAAAVAESVARDAVAPFARRHPVTVLVGAFFVGGAIVWFKPWRWLGRPALFAGLTSQIASHALTQMPWESLLGAITSFAHRREESGADADAEVSGVPADPSAEQEQAFQQAA